MTDAVNVKGTTLSWDSTEAGTDPHQQARLRGLPVGEQRALAAPVPASKPAADMRATADLLSGSARRQAAIALITALTVAASYVVFLLVERPLQRMAHRLDTDRAVRRAKASPVMDQASDLEQPATSSVA